MMMSLFLGFQQAVKDIVNNVEVWIRGWLTMKFLRLLVYMRGPQRNQDQLNARKTKRGGVTTKRIQNDYLNSLNELSLVMAIPSVIVRSAISNP